MMFHDTDHAHKLRIQQARPVHARGTPEARPVLTRGTRHECRPAWAIAAPRRPLVGRHAAAVCTVLALQLVAESHALREEFGSSKAEILSAAALRRSHARHIHKRHRLTTGAHALRRRITAHAAAAGRHLQVNMELAHTQIVRLNKLVEQVGTLQHPAAQYRSLSAHILLDRHRQAYRV